mgnify:CR=1 FL=1
MNEEDEFSMIPELSEECAALEERCAELGYKVVYISAAMKMGTKHLVDEVARMLRDLPPILVYESEITPEDEEFVIVPVSVNSETISTSGTIYIKDIVPYVETPVMAKLHLDKATIKFTYSTQTIIF